MTEREIFLTAREYADPAARAAFLDQACAHDPVLRQRIKRLLRADERADSLLDEPVVEPLASYQTESLDGTPNPEADLHAAKECAEVLHFLAPAGRPDSLGRIGHYEVLAVLGRGGCGTVSRAFDEVLQRVVAVKVLAPNWPSPRLRGSDSSADQGRRSGPVSDSFRQADRATSRRL
jgi:eukaryotic-like serine/threonine-protein kinase